MYQYKLSNTGCINHAKSSHTLKLANVLVKRATFMGQRLIYINDTACQQRALSQVNCSLLQDTYAYESLASILDPLPKSSKLLANPAMVAQKGSWVFGMSGIFESQFLTVDIYSPWRICCIRNELVSRLTSHRPFATHHLKVLQF